MTESTNAILKRMSGGGGSGSGALVIPMTYSEEYVAAADGRTVPANAVSTHDLLVGFIEWR